MGNSAEDKIYTTEGDQKLNSLSQEKEKSTDTDPAFFLKDNSTINIKSKNVFQSSKEYPTEELGSVYCKGVQYVDFKNVTFINNIILAKLIYLLKSLLKQGIEIRFVNMKETIKRKIRAIGLGNIFNC